MARIHSTHLAACLLVVAAVAVAGCASTELVSQWKSPAFSGPPLKKVMVVGVSSQPATRRIFEDEFSAALKAAGVDRRAQLHGDSAGRPGRAVGAGAGGQGSVAPTVC